MRKGLLEPRAAPRFGRVSRSFVRLSRIRKQSGRQRRRHPVGARGRYRIGVRPSKKRGRLGDLAPRHQVGGGAGMRRRVGKGRCRQPLPRQPGRRMEGPDHEGASRQRGRPVRHFQKGRDDEGEDYRGASGGRRLRPVRLQDEQHRRIPFLEEVFRGIGKSGATGIPPGPY